MSRRLDITSRLLHALSFLPMCNCGCCRLWPWHSSLPLCLARRCYMTGSTSGVSMLLKESRSRMLFTVGRRPARWFCCRKRPTILSQNSLALMLIPSQSWGLKLATFDFENCNLYATMHLVCCIPSHPYVTRRHLLYFPFHENPKETYQYLSLYMLLGLLEKWPNHLLASSRPFNALLDLCKTSKLGVRHSDKSGETDLQIFYPHGMEEKEACI